MNTPHDRRAFAQRVVRVQHHMLDKIDAVLDSMLPPPIDDAQNPVSPALLRATADLMGLWQLCGQAACFRARRCKRERGLCVARCIDRVPDDVRKDAAAVLRAARDRARLSAAS